MHLAQGKTGRYSALTREGPETESLRAGAGVASGPLVETNTGGRLARSSTFGKPPADFLCEARLFDYGHADLFLAGDAGSAVWEPILDWLQGL